MALSAQEGDVRNRRYDLPLECQSENTAKHTKGRVYRRYFQTFCLSARCQCVCMFACNFVKPESGERRVGADRSQPRPIPSPGVLIESGGCPRFYALSAELRQRRYGFPFPDANLSLCQCRPVRCLNLPRHAGIPLLGGLLDVLSVENEVIPIHPPSFENRHVVSSEKNLHSLANVLELVPDRNHQ